MATERDAADHDAADHGAGPDATAHSDVSQRGGGERAGGEVRPFPRPVPETVTFDRHELREILNLYGRKVAEGEWRDYAIDFSRETAVFSIFRRASEYPLYRVIKTPKLARKQGAFSVVTPTGLVLKRGHELRRVLAVLDKSLKLVTT